MRRLVILILLLFILGLPACMISEQVGDRTHVNSPHPDEITFHFDSPFNKAMLFGRSAALLLVSWWGFSSRGKGTGKTVLMILAAAALVGSVWLLIVGWPTVFHYRIDLRNGGLHMNIPSGPKADIPWGEFESINGEGMARDVTFGDGRGQALKWATEWEDMTITLVDGRQYDVDLRPLSVEQRGTLWRAIARMAELHHGGEWVEPVENRR
jgi:hypothetical protein